MSEKELYWKYSLISIIVILGLILFFKFIPFLGGILGAFTVYILVRKQLLRLTEVYKMHRGVAAILLLFEVVLCFMIPVSLAVWLFINKLQNINLNPTELIKSAEHLANIIQIKTGFDLLDTSNISSFLSVLPKIAQLLMNGISGFAINLVVMVLFLYFMLIGGRKMEQFIYSILPFSEENKKEVISRVNLLVISNAIGIPLLAVIQGAVALLGYLIFKVPSPFLFGFLTCFATIIPLIGTGLIWAPLALYLLITGNWVSALGLVAYAVLVITNVDNLTRFMLQKKLANTHPLITIFGVIIGLSLFGFMGIIFGPILISIFIACLEMYKKQYLDKILS